MDANESGFAGLRLLEALLEGDWRQIVQPSLEALAVVKQLDVFGDLIDRLLAGLEKRRGWTSSVFKVPQKLSMGALS